VNFYYLFPTLLALALPAVAQSNLSERELQEEVRACEEDKVCLFGLIEQRLNDGATADELANPWTLYGLMISGIDASIEAERPDLKLNILDRALQLLDENFGDLDEPNFLSSAFHLLRAELCLKTADEACFLQSAALLLEREIASREDAIFWEKGRAFTRDGNYDRLLPPIRWSAIRDLRYDSVRTGRGGWDGIGRYLNEVGSGTVETRIDAILSDYERRTL